MDTGPSHPRHVTGLQPTHLISGTSEYLPVTLASDIFAASTPTRSALRQGYREEYDWRSKIVVPGLIADCGNSVLRDGMAGGSKRCPE
jgi:hypothetical protein